MGTLLACPVWAYLTGGQKDHSGDMVFPMPATVRFPFFWVPGLSVEVSGERMIDGGWRFQVELAGPGHEPAGERGHLCFFRNLNRKPALKSMNS